MRFTRAFAEAGKPLPRFSPDDVVDFQVMEALVHRAAADRERKEDEDERKTWRESHSKDEDFLARARAQEGG